ncbi:hypothetical protein [Streptomyces sp. NBC_00859]|uniref:hypothetical protein n=1 Tax=Streptomyces sp. NBC_00859 TaxID=2903682 RepID=UPI00386A5897|nr:hypothetical protein OG584_19890 [Streptomyces sp. NBC_00859]
MAVAVKMRARNSVACLIAVGITLTVASGCDSSPTGPAAPQAGKKLSNDASRLLTKMPSLLQTKAHFNVSNNASKGVACGENKEKYQFSAKAHMSPVPNIRQNLDTSASGASGFLTEWGYDLHAKEGPLRKSDTKYVVPMFDKKAGAQITVMLTQTGAQSVDTLVTGTTDCLRLK